MSPRITSIWFFIIFIPMVYVCYMLLQCFDYEKILRRGKVRDLRTLMLVASIGLAYLFTQAFLEVINRFAQFL